MSHPHGGPRASERAASEESQRAGGRRRAGGRSRRRSGEAGPARSHRLPAAAPRPLAARPPASPQSPLRSPPLSSEVGWGPGRADAHSQPPHPHPSVGASPGSAPSRDAVTRGDPAAPGWGPCGPGGSCCVRAPPAQTRPGPGAGPRCQQLRLVFGALSRPAIRSPETSPENSFSHSGPTQNTESLEPARRALHGREFVPPVSRVRLDSRRKSSILEILALLSPPGETGDLASTLPW